MHAYSLIWCRHLVHWGFAFSDDPRLCQVDKIWPSPILIKSRPLSLLHFLDKLYISLVVTIYWKMNIPLYGYEHKYLKINSTSWSFIKIIISYYTLGDMPKKYCYTLGEKGTLLNSWWEVWHFENQSEQYWKIIIHCTMGVKNWNPSLFWHSTLWIILRCTYIALRESSCSIWRKVCAIFLIFIKAICSF